MELRGRRAICEHTKRSWKTLLHLRAALAFPMNIIGGVWVADTELIREWRNNQLRRR